jgi:tellurite resistance protein
MIVTSASEWICTRIARRRHEFPVKGGLSKKRRVMAKRYSRSNITAAELAADYLDQRDEQVMQALVTAGAFVAFADGQVEAVERDELVNFIHRLVPTISQHEIGEVFDGRVRQLEDRDSANVIVKAFRPLAGLSLSSVVVRTAERVAAADRHIHPNELQAIKLIRLIMTNLPMGKLPLSRSSQP